MLTMERLSPELQLVAQRELGETPQIRMDAITQLRTLIADEPDLRCPSDEAFLVKFLRARKYNVEKTLCTIRKYFRVRQVHTEIFDDLLPSRIMFDALFRDSKVLTMLEERDHLGRLVAILKSGPWKPDRCPATDVFRAAILVGEYCLMDETTQIAGIILIWNLEGINFDHIRHFTPSVMKMSVDLVQDCYPMRIKAVYIINNPPIAEIAINVVKLFLKSKLLERIHFIGRDYTKLHDVVPRERLPEEYGATLKNPEYEEFERGLRSTEDFFAELGKYGYPDKRT